MSVAASNPVSPFRRPLASGLPFPSRPTLPHTKLRLRSAAGRQDHLLIQPEFCRPTATREELLQSSFERVKILILKSCRRDRKVLRGGETWYREGSSVCVCVCASPLSFYSPGVSTKVWLKRGIVPWWYLSKNTRELENFSFPPQKVSTVNLSLMVIKWFNVARD